MDYTPPNAPLHSIQQQVQGVIPANEQAEWAYQRQAEQNAELELQLGAIATANALRFNSQG